MKRGAKKAKQKSPEKEMSLIPESFVQSEARFRALFATNIMGIALSDLEDTIIEANDAFLQLVGYSRKDLREGLLTWDAITPQAYVALDDKKVKEVLRYGKIPPFEKAYIHKKGHLVPVLVGAEIIASNPPLSVSFALDITHQKKIEQRKDDFVGTVSHELKTPLAVLRVHTDLLRYAVLNREDPESILHSIEEIENQIGKTTMMINDLATLTRVQMDDDEAGKDLFDVGSAISNVVEEVQLAHGRSIKWKPGRNFVFVRGNEERLKLVFSNLIRNAVRYSPKNKPITVKFTTDNRHAIVSVTDRGIGIHEEDRAAIFERYYRADHASAYNKEGTGIGLYICNDIVKSHRGRLEVESQLGRGSTFLCYIPLAAQKKKAKAVAEKKARTRRRS